LIESILGTTSLAASIGGGTGSTGTLNITNTSAATPNTFVAADTFTVNAGVLEGKADPTHPALGAAGIMLNGGT